MVKIVVLWRMIHKKVFLTNILITVLAISIFVLTHKYLVLLEQQSPFEVGSKKIFFTGFVPIIFGFVISLPLRKSNSNRVNIDWPKLLIQGIPAFCLGFQFQSLISVYMRIFNKTSLDLGVFNYLLMLQSQIPILNNMFGVWFGKILAESLRLPESKPHETNVTI